ncbi:MAG: hypothetical protein LBH20_08675 [Treponema sp.]|jgi:hypothetical protein|nr:hypothetical protein [Treponema sp.]
MKIITIKDVVRKDVPIYYRLLYTGVAVIEMTTDAADYRIDFSIETKPTGQREINVSFLDEPDYPLVPVIKELKKYIESMHQNGTLPD